MSSQIHSHRSIFVGRKRKADRKAYCFISTFHRISLGSMSLPISNAPVLVGFPIIYDFVVVVLLKSTLDCVLRNSGSLTYLGPPSPFHAALLVLLLARTAQVVYPVPVLTT